MSNSIEKLHTAIRRYCMERYTFWTENYTKLNDSGKGFSFDEGYSNKALATFPRYNVMSAILTEIERHRPSDFSEFEEAKEFFKLAIKDAQNIFTEPPNEKIEEQAMNEERKLLCEYIETLDNEDLEYVEPLFYRYVLSEIERELIWGKLKDKWNHIGEGYWYPLTTWKMDGVEAFQDSYFEKEFSFEKLQDVLKELGTKKLWEFREDNINAEIELSIFEPCFTESYWFDESFEWLIYASHESSITFAGSILPKIKENWENWEERLWKYMEFS